MFGSVVLECIWNVFLVNVLNYGMVIFCIDDVFMGKVDINWFLVNVLYDCVFNCLMLDVSIGVVFCNEFFVDKLLM